MTTCIFIQEKYCYVCPDIAKEFSKYDLDPSKWLKAFDGANAVTKKSFSVDVGYERFLGPEIFFHPEVSCTMKPLCTLKNMKEGDTDIFICVIQTCTPHPPPPPGGRFDPKMVIGGAF